MTSPQTIPTVLAASDPSPPVAETDPASIDDASLSLRGQICVNPTACIPFENSNLTAPLPRELDGTSATALSADDLTPSYAPRFDEFHFDTARPFPCDKKPGLMWSGIPAKTIMLANAKYEHSITPQLPEAELKNRGVSDNSILARMNHADIAPELGKDWFREKASRAGYPFGENLDDDKLALAWEKLKDGDPADWRRYSRLMGATKTERIAFALEFARAVMFQKIKSHPNIVGDDAAYRANEFAKMEMEAHLEKAEDVTDRKIDASYMIDAKINLRNLSSLPHAEHCHAGQEVIRSLLAPPSSEERSNLNATLTTQEFEKVLRTFTDSYHEYAARVKQRTNAFNDQNIYLAGNCLPRLKQPVCLRGDRKAYEIRAQKMSEYFDKQTRIKNKNVRSWLTETAKDLAAVAGSVFAFPLFFFPQTFPDFAEFCRARVWPDYRLGLANAYALEEETRALRNINRRNAEEWVKAEYAPQEQLNDLQIGQALYDPHGFFAAFANEDRDSIVNSVKDQITHAILGDILGAREKLAAALNAPVSEDVQLPDEDLLLDANYIQEMAEGIVDGMAAGLQWAAQKQTELQNGPDQSMAARLGGVESSQPEKPLQA